METIYINRCLVCLLLAISAFAACKKPDSNPPGSSLREKFIGTWKLTRSIDDTNNNSTIDSTDITTIMDSFQVIVKLNADGSASSSTIFTGANPSLFTWSLANKDTCINLLQNGTNTLNTQIIIHAPDTYFVVKDTLGGTRKWETFVKQ